ncbi:DSCAM [Mytilus edulis]|uniref:DSCAM n=1 Tax=Mytilus edulis TaxID=6550 RepID=A0A8S3R4G5_MYTED|nr:DSCAM [Mytilus edulis]
MKGNIQKVLVKTGDTIVLNCTCTNQTNGLWDGPKKSPSKINGWHEDTLMPYAQGTLLNSKLNLSKYYILGSYKNRTCNLMIKTISSNDEGKYHCQYVKNDTTISRFYRVNIQTPLDVTIKTTNFENTTYLECHATGEYTKDGRLELKKDNYQNSGIYICRVNDEFIDMEIEHNQQEKQVFVQYEGPPVFVSNNSKTWFRQCTGDVNVTLKVFTLSDITSEPIRKLEEKSDERQSTEVIGSLMNLTCRDHLVFYKVSVQVSCVEVTFNIKPMKDKSRNYSSKVCFPEPPSIVSLISDETKIFMKWHSGLKRGCSKNFFIQYRQSTLTNWTDVGPIPDHKEKDGAFTLSDLYPDIQYEIRMFARNKVEIVLKQILQPLSQKVSESVDNRLYLSTDFRQSNSTGNQLEIQPTEQPNSALDSHYLEDITEEQNAFHADEIIPTQHTESNLNYAEVIFEAAPSTSTGVVNGKEDRTIYSEIDLLCHVDTIPSSSESDDDFMYVDGIENYKKQTCL